jgi:hypothetical protein
MSEPEYSEGGSRIYRYDNQPDPGWTPPDMSGGNLEEISAHIEEHVGPIDMVWHEIISDKVHIDVHVVNPTPDRPYYTLVTSGMSDLPMHAPQGAEQFKFAELMLCLPPDWPMDQDAWQKDEASYWPIRMLKSMARFPHDYRTWLFWGHTVPNGNPPAPLAEGCALIGCMLAEPMTVSTDFFELEISAEKTIHFLALYPLYQEEMDLKLKKGAEELLKRFHRAKISEIINPRRKNVGKNTFWPF